MKQKLLFFPFVNLSGLHLYIICNSKILEPSLYVKMYLSCFFFSAFVQEGIKPTSVSIMDSDSEHALFGKSAVSFTMEHLDVCRCECWLF